MTEIEWTHRPGSKGETWNPVVGCSIVSPGCTNCYAMQQADRIKRMEEGRTGRPDASHYFGTTKVVNGNAVWTGKIVSAPDHIWTKPLRWSKPRTVFVNSMGDLFHEDVSLDWICRAFAIMALAPQHTFIVLTKRADRMRHAMTSEDVVEEIYDMVCHHATATGDVILRADGLPPPPPHFKAPHVWLGLWPLPNVWLGVTAEDQTRADERIPDLLATPAAVRLVSVEPMLGPVNLRSIAEPESIVTDALTGESWTNMGGGAIARRDARIDWIICGGESGDGARPMHPDWARALRDQCAAAGVPFFFKQWGSWLPTDQDAREVISYARHNRHCFNPGTAQELWTYRTGKSAAGHLLDGVEHHAFPVPLLRS